MISAVEPRRILYLLTGNSPNARSFPRQQAIRGRLTQRLNLDGACTRRDLTKPNLPFRVVHPSPDWRLANRPRISTRREAGPAPPPLLRVATKARFGDHRGGIKAVTSATPTATAQRPLHFDGAPAGCGSARQPFGSRSLAYRSTTFLRTAPIAVRKNSNFVGI
jgi:hypothetical protein